MIKLIVVLLAAIFLFRQSAFCQTTQDQDRQRDRLVSENQRMYATVDSLRKIAIHQNKVNQSLSKMVANLSHRKDSATNGLAGRRVTYNRQSAQFDSTLDRLDSCSTVLKKLADSLEQANRKN